MTILLTKPLRVGGVELASGTTQTLGASLEADVVARGWATYTTDPMVGRTVPVVATTDPVTGGSTLSGPTSTLKLPAGETDLSGGVGGGGAQSSLKSAITAYNAGLRTRPPIILGLGDSNFTGEGSGSGSGTVPKLTGAFLNNPVQKIKSFMPTLGGLRVINTAVFGEGNITANACPVAEYDPRITLGSGWAPSAAAGAIGGRLFECATIGGDLTINFGERIDTVEIYCGKWASGSADVSIKSSDDTVIGSVTTFNASNAYAVTTFTNAKFADGIVKIKNNAAGTAYIIGVVAYPTNEKVVVLAQSSWSAGLSANYSNITPPLERRTAPMGYSP